MKKRLLASFLFFFVLTSGTGCAARLSVYSAQDHPNEFRGIRVHTPVSYMIRKEIQTEKCPLRVEDEIIHLPIGEAYDINFTPALLGKNEFTVSFSENGMLKQVSLNSTPQVAEMIKALGELTEKFGAALKPSAKGGETACGPVISETITSVKRLKATE